MRRFCTGMSMRCLHVARFPLGCFRSISLQSHASVLLGFHVVVTFDNDFVIAWVSSTRKTEYWITGMLGMKTVQVTTGLIDYLWVYILEQKEMPS